MKIVIEQNVGKAESQDRGLAKIIEFNSRSTEIFVRIYSWSKDHPEMTKMENRRVRVTIETV